MIKSTINGGITEHRLRMDTLPTLFATPRNVLDTGETKPVHIFFHLPRCAGNTIHHHLSTNAPQGSYFRVKKQKGFSRFVLPRYRVSDLPTPASLNAISGHWIGDSIKHRFADRVIARSLLLRDPVSQFVSHYNFRMMRYISMGLGAYPLEIAYQARERNALTHFILRTFAEIPRWRLAVLSTKEKYAEANRFLSSFFFVGDYTRCDELITALAQDLEIPIRAERRNTTEQWLESVDWVPITIRDLSPRLADRIKQDNMLDQILWETWRNATAGSVNPRPYSFVDERPITRVAIQSSRVINQAKRRIYRGWRLGTSRSPCGK